MKKILILGASGSLGHQVYYRLKKISDYKVFPIAHSHKLTEDTFLLDARKEFHLEQLINDICPDVIVNCIGILIKRANEFPDQAIYLNAYLPHKLRKIADNIDARLIHISTDCVFSGDCGSYVESSLTDAKDIYGKSKALGEVFSPPHLTLRTSIVGPELKNGEGLFNWFLLQKGIIQGYTEAYWSGVTTLVLASVIEWAIENPIYGLHHVTNGNSISKFLLLELFKKYTKKDILIKSVKGKVSDKSFVDTRKEIKVSIPDYDEMISDMVGYMNKNKDLYPQYFL